MIRDCLFGEVLLARGLLSARQEDLAGLLGRVRDAAGVPVVGVTSDGQRSARKAVARALPAVPHRPCRFHYLREAARPIYESDRHAKKELEKKVRQVRGIERSVEGRTGNEAEAVRGYCGAVRSALADDGRQGMRWGASVLDEGPAFPDPAKRFKLGWRRDGVPQVAASAEGLSWKPLAPGVALRHDYDINCVFRDPARGRYGALVSSYRTGPKWKGKRRVTLCSVSDDLALWKAPGRS